MTDEERLSYRLLIVDDEVDFLRALSLALSRRGFEVVTAEEGGAALEALRKGRFDVVLLDVKMPGIDGVEVFTRITERWPSLPVIFLTGHGTLGQAFQTSKRGAFDYLSKPVDVEHLLALLQRAAREGRRGRRLRGWVRKSGEEPESPPPEVDVLLIDDEAELRGSLTKVLERRGMTVASAGTGGAGLALASERSFDVVVLDLLLPDVEGLEVLRGLKRIAPMTEVILLTGHPTISSAVRGLQLGAYEFFVKPHDPEALAETIREAYWNRRERAAKEARRLADEFFCKYPS